MICKHILSYCCDDITQIENYDKAINDTTQTWHCHHRLETDLDLTEEQLKEQSLYFNRPASELIFLTPFEHISLHKKGKQIWLGKKHTEESKEKMRQSQLKYFETHDGPMKGRTQTEEAKQKLREANLGKKHSEETKRKISEKNKNKVYTQETRRKMSESNPRKFKGMSWKIENGKRVWYTK